MFADSVPVGAILSFYFGITWPLFDEYYNKGKMFLKIP